MSTVSQFQNKSKIDRVYETGTTILDAYSNISSINSEIKRDSMHGQRKR